MTFLSHILVHARERPDHPALQEASRGTLRSLSYAELARLVEARAAVLRASGVAAGDRCGLLARQGTRFVTEALSILEAGACLVPIPSDHGDAATVRFAENARLHHLIRESEDFACRHVVAPDHADPREDAAFRALEPAYLRFTSGTTSARKGVILSHGRISERLEAANTGLRIGPQDRIVWLLPMAHHFVVSILLYLRFGASVVLPESSLARHILELAEHARATFLYASPFHYQLLAKDASGLRLDSARLAVSTAEGLRGDVATRFHQRFDLPLCQALGIIEVGLPVINLDEAATKPTALGRPLAAYEVWLRDEEGKPILGPGSPERSGEICIRGPGLFDAYLAPWTPAAAIVEPDGFRTGDQGWFDAQGTLHLAGRRHNRINMAGMKFFSEEVEAVLARHPTVLECRVRAREHAHLGEIPVAEIVLRDPNAPPGRQDFMAHCRRELPTYKIPREYHIVDALPRTATGKLQR